jgi:hypothetical protein
MIPICSTGCALRLPGSRPPYGKNPTLAAPGEAVFQSRILKDSRGEREAYFAECSDLFADRDIVFFDPDNGIERSIAVGRRGSSKYVYWNEIVATFRSGASILFYQHFPREKRESFTTRLLDELRCRTESVHVRAWPTSRVVFLGAFHERHCPFPAPYTT